MKVRLSNLLLALSLFMAPLQTAHSQSVSEPALSANDARRASQLIERLRCPACENQNLVESNSPLARDLRSEVLQRVTAGESDKTIEEALIARYGQFISYRPALNPTTWLLWGAPPLLLVLGGLWLASRTHRHTTDKRQDAEPAQPVMDPLPVASAENTPTPPRWLWRVMLLASLTSALLLYPAFGHYGQWRHWQANPDPLLALSGDALKNAAGERLRQRIKANVRDRDAWAELAQWLLYQNRFDESLWAYQRLAELEGETSAATHAARATVLYYQAGQQLTPAAHRELKQALAQDSKEVTALMLLASDHFLNARYAEAASLWQQLLDDNRPRLDREAVIRALQVARQLAPTLAIKTPPVDDKGSTQR